MTALLRTSRITLGTLFLIFLGAGLSACQGPAPVGALQVDEEALHTTYSDWPVDSAVRLMERFPNGTQIALATYHKGQTNFWGLQRIDDSLHVVDNAGRVFEIGSISKVFTSTILAQAITEGRVTADQPVDSLLGYTLQGNPGITLQQLANHTSGLPRLPSNLMLYAITHPHNPYKEYSPDQLKTYLTDKLDINTESGTDYEYSNLGAGLLGYALTQLYGQSYEVMLQTNIAGPLGMSQTTTRLENVADQVVNGLQPNGRPAAHWEFTDATIGAGGILSTTRDLMQYLQAQLAGEQAHWAVQQAQTFSVNDNMALGLGWHILHQENGAHWHWHNGGTGGYRTSMAMDTALQTAAVVLTNISSGHPASGKVDQFNFTLMRHLSAAQSE